MQDRSLPAIVSLTVAQRAYLRAQGIAVIAVTADGVVKIARDIARIHKPVAAWLVRARRGGSPPQALS